MKTLTRRRRTNVGAFTPGQRGHLRLHIDVDRDPVDHEGDYRFVGLVNGHLAFAPATPDPVVYLTEREVVSFQ